ncbi:MAG: RIP metalloprotease RseP [Verrucomicrobium sp.]|nr:RIP metalloprotease RseP [Verrucomicrobium sp.]
MTLSYVLRFLFILGEVLFFYNLLILVHEIGHFLAARWRGLVVDKFGIWFGKPIWKKRIGGVEYRFGTLPFGGFVALPQMAPMEVIEGKTDTETAKLSANLPPVKPLDKIIVALAGPIFSFGLAIVFAFLVWWIGRPVSESEGTTTVGYVLKDSPAEKAGIHAGDRILRVDNHAVTRFAGMANDAITWRIVRSEGATIPIDVDRDGQPLHFEVAPKKAKQSFFRRQSLRQIEILPAQTPIVGSVFPGSPAAGAGLQPGDQILSVDGQRLHSLQALGEYIVAHHGQVTLDVRRKGEVFPVSLTPEVPVGETDPRIGIVWDASGIMQLTHPKPWEQIRASVATMGNTLAAVFSPKSDIKAQHLSGPIGIMRFNYILFESDNGWKLVLWFGVLINVNLALLNLLPIPVLDGGHILLALIEWVRGRPMSVRVLEVIQTGCAMLVIGYILYVSFFDIQDLSLPDRQKALPQMKFAPHPPS